MNRTQIMIISVLFVMIVAALFGVSYWQGQRTSQSTAPVATSTPVATTTDPYASITRINAKHFYQNGLHTLVGTVSMPTPCDLLNATATPSVAGDQVVVAFSVINTTAGNCAAQVTSARFMVTAHATASTSFSATFIGRPVTLNIFPALPGETPNSFELFQKG